MHAKIGVHADSIVAALALMLACGLPPAHAQTKLWRHGIVEPKGDAGFAMMVTEGGFAAKQGLQVELPQFQNDAIALRALLAGEVESYDSSPTTAIVADSRNVDVKIIGCHWQTLVHSVFARGEVAKAQDLKGKTFAISAPGALPDLLARAVLEQNSIGSSDVKFVEVPVALVSIRPLNDAVAGSTRVSLACT